MYGENHRTTVSIACVDRPGLVVTCFGNATKIFHRVRNQIVVASRKQAELMEKTG